MGHAMKGGHTQDGGLGDKGNWDAWDAGCLGPGRWMLDSGCLSWMLDAECWMLDARRRLLDATTSAHVLPTATRRGSETDYKTSLRLIRSLGVGSRVGENDSRLTYYQSNMATSYHWYASRALLRISKSGRATSYHFYAL